jgi:hypothetical protein
MVVGVDQTWHDDAAAAVYYFSIIPRPGLLKPAPDSGYPVAIDKHIDA